MQSVVNSMQSVVNSMQCVVTSMQIVVTSIQILYDCKCKFYHIYINKLWQGKNAKHRRYILATTLKSLTVTVTI
jgi:hypothetical protein